MDFEDDYDDEVPDFELDIDPAELGPRGAEERSEAKGVPRLAPPPGVTRSESPGARHGAPSAAPTRSSPAHQRPVSTGGGSRTRLIVSAAIAAAVALAVYVLYWDDWFPPSPEGRVAHIGETPNGAVTYEGVVYPSEWKKGAEFSGIVQQMTTTYVESMPFLTHEVVLVTGDYANPEKVQISELKNHRVNYAATSTPKGSIRLVHILPANAAALQALDHVRPQQWVTLRGDELTGALIAPNQRALQMRGQSKVLRLREVSQGRPEPGPDDPDASP